MFKLLLHVAKEPWWFLEVQFILFQLLNLHLWQAAHCTLTTAQCTLRSAPSTANAPEYEHVHFILHNEHCTLHTKCLYCILQIYHFILQSSKICLCCSQDLHCKMYLDLTCSLSEYYIINKILSP